jgi:hypothetical protein
MAVEWATAGERGFPRFGRVVLVKALLVSQRLKRAWLTKDRGPSLPNGFRQRGARDRRGQS